LPANCHFDGTNSKRAFNLHRQMLLRLQIAILMELTAGGLLITKQM